MKAIARNYCYWKNIDKDIEKLVNSCKACSDVKNQPTKAPPHIWQPPSENFERVHMDYAGPFLKHHFLIVVDAKSKWLEIYKTQTDPTSKITIRFLKNIFSRFGTPTFLVNDNASIFVSKETLQFCKDNGIEVRNSAPNHPATNGQAERYVQIFKRKLKCMVDDGGDLDDKLNRLLFSYRTTPLANGKTPAELMLGWKPRTKLDLLRPRNKATYTPDNDVIMRQYKEGQRVQSRNYTGNMLWKYGTIKKCLGKLHYVIELDNGYTIKRHIDQLRPSGILRTSTGEDEPIIMWDTDGQQTATAGAPAPPQQQPQQNRQQPVQQPRQRRQPQAQLQGQVPPPAPVRRSTRIPKPTVRMNL